MSTSGGGCGSLDKATKAYIFEYQEPATLNQAAPIQNTWYDILPETSNVIIYDYAVNIEDDDETIEVRITMDGQIISTAKAATHSTTYHCVKLPNAINRSAEIGFQTASSSGQAFQYFAKTAQIEVRKTTANGAGNLTGIVEFGVLTSI